MKKKNLVRQTFTFYRKTSYENVNNDSINNISQNTNDIIQRNEEKSDSKKKNKSKMNSLEGH